MTTMPTAPKPDRMNRTRGLVSAGARALLLATACGVPSVAFAAATGSDLELGGAGDGPGQFHDLRDLAFDAQDNIFTLEAGRFDDKTKTFVGSCRVQKFDPAGKPLLQFSIRDEALGERLDPRHIAVDAKGFIYVTHTNAGIVQRFKPDGKPDSLIKLPRANAIAPWTVDGHSQIAVVAAADEVVNGKWAKMGGEQVDVITSEGVLGTPVKLAHLLTSVSDIATDRAGNLYAIADSSQLYKFDSKGALLRTMGTGESTRAEDGSELLHTVAVDSTGKIFTMAYGNPGVVVQFSADFETVTTRPGEFKWADPWSMHSGYTALAVDSHDRMWAAICHEFTPDNPNYKHYNPAPALVRAVPNYFEVGVSGVTQASTLVLGLKPDIVIGAPSSVTYDLKPVPIDIILKKSARQVDQTSVNWHIYDMYHADVAHGTVNVPLEDGVEAKSHVDFTPPAYGWYLMSCEFTGKGKLLSSISKFFGVTHRYPGMVALDEGVSKGGMPDPMRQMFSGLLNERLHASHTKESFDALEGQIKGSQAAGTTWFVQLSDKADCTPENVRAAVTRFKGQVKVWEIMNEPNFSFGNPADYVAVLKQAYAIIKEIDPAAKVMGPDVCGVNIGWYEAFYKAGGKDVTDILSIHDYEGHEGIDPAHWRWKFAELRKLMAANGDKDKPLWQTERAITAVRGDNFLGSTQAVRTTLHRDLLESLGVSPEHNNHFYINDHGFGGCPSFVWSGSGPHPAALALRVRHAMTTGRAYKGAIDFGKNGNDIYLGLRYVGDDGSTIVLRNLGALDGTMDIGVTGGPALDVVDGMGNEQSMPVKDGKVRVAVRQMPIYLRLKKGQDATLPTFDFGKNMAPRATIAYSGAVENDVKLLTNGVLETVHAGHPQGGTEGKNIWTADLATGPKNLDIVFDQARPIDKVVLQGVRADNAFCALLDYDLQYLDGKAWKTIEEVRTPCPASEASSSQMSKANTWYLDNNLFVNSFAPVMTSQLRLVIRRVTHGFVPDDKSRAWGNIIPCKLMLRELEVYGPPSPVEMTASLGSAEKTAAFAQETLTVSVANRSAKSVDGKIKALLPAGWSATPAEAPLKVDAGKTGTATVTIVPPKDMPIGATGIDVALVDASGKQIGLTWLTLTVASPVELAAQAPTALDKTAQPLSIAIKNVSKEAVSGSARVELSGRTALPPVEQAFGPIASGQSATVTFSVPDLDLAGGAWKATYTVRANNLVATTTQDMSVRAWSVIGPFAKDFAKDFGPETKVDFTKTYSDQMGNEQKWQSATSGSNGFVDLSPHFNPHDNVCAYAVAYVQSPDVRKAVMWIGADDGDKAWVNGKLVHAEDGAHGASPGQFKPEIDLKAGWNEVLLKITQGGGGWGFYCDILAANGAKMPDLVFAPRKP